MHRRGSVRIAELCLLSLLLAGCWRKKPKPVQSASSSAPSAPAQTPRASAQPADLEPEPVANEPDGGELSAEQTADVKMEPLPVRPPYRRFSRAGGAPLLRGVVSVAREAEHIHDSRPIWLERRDSSLEGLLADERGLPSVVAGVVGPDGRFELHAIGKHQALLRGALKDGAAVDLQLLVTPFAFGDTPAVPAGLMPASSLPFASPAAAATQLAGGAPWRYLGFVGERAVLVELRPGERELSGELRLGNGESHALHGALSQDGTLRLEERKGDSLLGTLELALASDSAAALQWAPLWGSYTPSAGKGSFVVLEPNQAFELASARLGPGLALEPHFALYMGASCEFHHEWPVLSGPEHGELNRRLAALSMQGIHAPICDAPYASYAMRPYLVERSYQSAPLGAGLFGVKLEYLEDGNGAHEMVGWACYLVDVGRARVLDLAHMMAKPDELASLVTRKLLSAQHAKSLQQLRTPDDKSNPGDPNEVVPIKDADFCPTAAGLTIAFDPYVLGPWSMGANSVTLTRAEAKPLFVGDASLDTYLR